MRSSFFSAIACEVGGAVWEEEFGPTAGGPEGIRRKFISPGFKHHHYANGIAGLEVADPVDLAATPQRSWNLSGPKNALETAMRRRTVDVFRVGFNGSEELLASGLSSEEVDEIREWFCYTKPMERSMRIVVRSAPNSGFSVLTAGHQSELSKRCSSELELSR